MKTKNALVPVEQLQNSILFIRGEKVMIDSDLAEIFGVSTKRLKEQIRRNIDRFPKDFMFQLTEKEKAEVVANCGHLKKLRFSPYLPYAFTEHGAVMIANVLNSQTAVKASILVVRAFVKLREVISTHKELAVKLKLLENKSDKHDKEIRVLFEAIRQLMQPPNPPRKLIGFKISAEE